VINLLWREKLHVTCDHLRMREINLQSGREEKGNLPSYRSSALIEVVKVVLGENKECSRKSARRHIKKAADPTKTSPNGEKSRLPLLLRNRKRT